MRRIVPLFVGFLVLAGMRSDSPSVLFDDIPLFLYENANAIVTSEERRFFLENNGRGQLHVKTTIKVLNAEGRIYGRKNLFYSSMSSLRGISGEVFDANGRRVFRLRNRDITDNPAVSDYSLIDDSRVKSFELVHNTYPYTIVFEYQENHSGLIDLPAWRPFYPTASILKSSYEVSVPSHIELFYHTENEGLPDPVVNQTQGRTFYTWSVQNQLIPKRYPLSPTWEEAAPALYLRTSDFQYGRHHGSLRSWESFGDWIDELWRGRDRLPESVRRDVLELTKDLETDEEKIAVLYEFLQKTTRYISIQLGIGGLQTDTAEQTAQTRYGDCKALTNYMMAMLREVGIEAYPALIRHGSQVPDVKPEFPTSRFNHVVLFIPRDEDAIWLECTSKSSPPGYLGWGNANRHALVVRPNGQSTLVRTPEMGHLENTQERRATVNLDAGGNATSVVNTLYGGFQQESYRSLFSRGTPREKERYVISGIFIPRFELQSFTITPDEESVRMNLELNMLLPRYATSTGSRLVFMPNLMERYSSDFGLLESRSQPVHLRYTYTDTDEIVYRLPEGYRVETLPEGGALEAKFGEYSASILYDAENHTIVYRRDIVIKSRRLPASEYNDYALFMNAVRRLDNMQVVLVRE